MVGSADQYPDLVAVVNVGASGEEELHGSQLAGFTGQQQGRFPVVLPAHATVFCPVSQCKEGGSRTLLVVGVASSIGTATNSRQRWESTTTKRTESSQPQRRNTTMIVKCGGASSCSLTTVLWFTSLPAANSVWMTRV